MAVGDAVRARNELHAERLAARKKRDREQRQAAERAERAEREFLATQQANLRAEFYARRAA